MTDKKEETEEVKDTKSYGPEYDGFAKQRAQLDDLKKAIAAVAPVVATTRKYQTQLAEVDKTKEEEKEKVGKFEKAYDRELKKRNVAVSKLEEHYTTFAKDSEYGKVISEVVEQSTRDNLTPQQLETLNEYSKQATSKIFRDMKILLDKMKVEKEKVTKSEQKLRSPARNSVTQRPQSISLQPGESLSSGATLNFNPSQQESKSEEKEEKQ